MPISPKTKEKEQKRDLLLRHLGASKKTRSIILTDIADSMIDAFLQNGAPSLDVTIVPRSSVPSELMIGADAYIADEILDIAVLKSLMAGQVVPIVPTHIADQAKLSEFNPMKFEGNAFLFDSVSVYTVFEKLVRYLENIRYPGDKRTLLQNLEKGK
jgi:hypothetical protein